jgi:dTDP-4-dehydrorhamnose 3,5-epimerase
MQGVVRKCKRVESWVNQMSIEIYPTEIPDVKIIRPKRHADSRGFFSETYNKKVLSEAGIDLDFVQDNHSLSVEKGVVRGLHYQMPPFAQDKLVRVIRGSIFDVAVDLRKSSPTFGRHVAAVLSAEEWNQILIPIGFAHGFCTLEPNTEVIYKVTNYYAPDHDRGLFWNDPQLGIQWPISPNQIFLSDKDKRLPSLSELRDFF